jgi:glycerol-3-phosphate dehydrogenase (NAD(P)+)
LAIIARRAGNEVKLWVREPEIVIAINREHRNPVFLTGIDLDPKIEATGDIAHAAKADILLMAAPVQHFRAVCRALAPHVGSSTPLVICSKGIERESCALLSEIVAAELPGRPVAVLSGPTFADEVARGLPAAVTLACPDEKTGRALCETLESPRFRLYPSTDAKGAQIGGAVKNVLAIACGLIEGRGLGANARAAFLIRGFDELRRFCAQMGGRPETLMGPAGLGDLVLTCMSPRSRNTSLGIALGKGQKLEHILESRPTVAEGIATSEAVAALAERLAVEMPIAEGVNAILHKSASIDSVLDAWFAKKARATPVEKQRR